MEPPVGAQLSALVWFALVSEDEFDAIFVRVQQRELPYWADPQHTQDSTINDNGRGFYFEDAEGNNLEVLTRSHGA